MFRASRGALSREVSQVSRRKAPLIYFESVL
jgi:hypothetical protein